MKINSSAPGLASCFTERPREHYHQSKLGVKRRQLAEGKELKLNGTKIIYGNIKYITGFSLLEKSLAFQDHRKYWITFLKTYDEPRFNVSKADPKYFFFCSGSKPSLIVLCVLRY